MPDSGFGHAGNRKDPHAAWAKVAVEKQTPSKRNDLTIILSGPAPATARVMWWETRTGVMVREHLVKPVNGALRMRPPPFHRDIACQVAPE